MNTKVNYVKLFFSFSLILAVSGLLFFSSCNDTSKKQKQDVTAEDVKGEMKEAADTAAAYLDQEREEILASYRSNIENTQKQIADLRDQLEKTTTKVNVELNNRIDSLQKQQDEARKELQELERSSGEAWDEMREGLDEALDEIDEGIENARKEFK